MRAEAEEKKIQEAIEKAKEEERRKVEQEMAIQKAKEDEERRIREEAERIEREKQAELDRIEAERIEKERIEKEIAEKLEVERLAKIEEENRLAEEKRILEEKYRGIVFVNNFFVSRKFVKRVVKFFLNGIIYILLKIMVERFRIYPVIAQIITITIVIVFSYMAQRNFSFRIDANEEETTG